jgi:protein-L-isoaspartate O-methyltransferase
VTTAVERRRQLADVLVAKGAVHSPWLRRAFQDTPREVFVPRFYRRSESGQKMLADGTDPAQREQWLCSVYTDDALTVQLTPAPDLVDRAGAPTSWSSMPTVMAGMLEALDLQPEHRVLEIGTGYNAALLCQRVGADNVASVELDPALAGAARRALSQLGLRPRAHTGDGAAGLPEHGPFGRIIATASADHIPPAWISQLAPAGVIVVDLRGSLDGCLLRLTPAEISGHGTDGSWFTAGLHPDHDGLYPVAQGGPQRLWDTVESSYVTWRRLDQPGSGSSA